MELTQKGKVFLYILLASAFFSISAITFGFFPYLGLSLSFIIFTLLAYSIKSEKTHTTKVFCAISLILSAFLAIRSEPTVTLLDLAGIFFFGSLFALVKDNKTFNNLFSIILTPVMLFIRSIFIGSDYTLEFNETKSKEKRREDLLNYTIGILITIAALAVILPLLSSANPYFKNLMTEIMNFLGLANLKIGETLAQWLVRLIFFIGLVFLVPRMATLVNRKADQPILLPEGFNLLIPKIAVAIVLIVFFITQLELYLSTPETLVNLGYSYSRYTNEVFAQLSAVGIVILLLIFMDIGKKMWNRKMTLILDIEGTFLSLMAFKSVYEYISMWGFTYKRLYGFSVATWIMGIFLIFLYTYLNNNEKYAFAVKSLIYTGVIVILINFANFDYLIYHVKPPTIGSGVDYGFLSKLSADSFSFDEQLTRITTHSGELTLEDKQKADSEGILVLLYKIEALKEKYSNLDIRGFNLNEYRQYKTVKNIDTKSLRDMYKLPSPD